VAQRKLHDIADTKADMVVSSCQQCSEPLPQEPAGQGDLVVKDLTELIFEAMA